MLEKYKPSKAKVSKIPETPQNYVVERPKSRNPHNDPQRTSNHSVRSYSTKHNDQITSFHPKHDDFFSNSIGNVFNEVRNHQVQIFKEFDQIQKKLFKGFDDFFPSMKSPFDNFDSIHKEMQDLMSFSNIGNSMNSMNGPSKVITRSYVQSTKLDGNGQKYTEKYFSNNYAMKGNDGTTISERQQGYANSGNQMQKIAEERMINNKGKKLIQERVRGGPTNKIEHFWNMDERDVPDFDSKWDHHTDKLGFYKDFGKMLGYNGTKQIYDDNSNYQMGSYKPKFYYTNDDPVIINKEPNHGRYRSNDLQPTIPNARAIQMGHDNQRERPERPERLQLEPPRVYEAPQRNNERVNVGGGMGLRNDGNFRNKNVNNNMPRAG